MHILVAGTAPEANARAASVLALAGWEVSQAHTAADALEACLSAKPDVVVVDAVLADELTARIKTDPELYSSAVVVVGCSPSAEAAWEGLEGGVHTYVSATWAPGELLGAVRSAGRLRLAQEELLTQSQAMETLIYADALTSLYNRRFLHRELTVLIAAARRHRRDLSIVLVDIDHFKSINDTYGHLAGDRVLVEVATRLGSRLRESDYLGRLGGEEFLALLPDTAAADAAIVAEALRAAIARPPIVIDGEHLRVTVSAGWAAWSAETPDQLLARADQALYQAKADGRNVVRGASVTRSASQRR
jgi:two-component system cell cycle response regulator